MPDRSHMNITIARLHNKLPELEFAALQRKVFADIQCESAALATVLSAENACTTAIDPDAAAHAPMVRFGAYVGDALVGWSFGWFERGNNYYMANSGVVPEFRCRGVYAALLEAVIAHAAANGTLVVRSQHSVLNNAVIICKLKRGFHIVGLNMSAQMGGLVELALHLSPERGELFASRTTPLVVPHVG